MTASGPDGTAPVRSSGEHPALIDTHVHFWDHSLEGFHWPWLDPGFEHRLLRDTHRLDAPRYTAPEYAAEVSSSAVCGMVHAQAAGPMPDPSLESEWLQRMADETGWPNAVIGSCELRSEGAGDLLRRHAGWTRVRGVRDITASRGIVIDEVAPTLDVAAELNLSIELRVPVDRFPVLGELAERWPEVTFVLSHAGLPVERTADDLARWSAAVIELAAHPNWVCKISAVAGASDPDWTRDSIRPWVMGCVAAFGADRCMFGTNWPVDRLFSRHEVLVGAYRDVTAELDPESRADLFQRTAARAYRIPADELRPIWSGDDRRGGLTGTRD